MYCKTELAAYQGILKLDRNCMRARQRDTTKIGISLPRLLPCYVTRWWSPVQLLCSVEFQPPISIIMTIYNKLGAIIIALSWPGIVLLVLLHIITSPQWLNDSIMFNYVSCVFRVKIDWISWCFKFICEVV